MIRSFKDKALQRFYETENTRGLSVQNTRRLRVILLALNAATKPSDLDVPGLRFHPLGGPRKGRYSVDASGNWRVTFGWTEKDAIDVDLEDYH